MIEKIHGMYIGSCDICGEETELFDDQYAYKEACKNWWNKYTDKEKAVIMSMPNFDKDKFKQITGIEV